MGRRDGGMEGRREPWTSHRGCAAGVPSHSLGTQPDMYLFIFIFIFIVFNVLFSQSVNLSFSLLRNRRLLFVRLLANYLGKVT